MKGRRRGHTRTSKSGTTFHVREHAFESGKGSREFSLTWRGGEARINGSVTYQMHCPQCKKPVFFYRNNDTGGRVFFDALGKPWPKHGCAQGVRKMQEINVVEATPVTQENRFDKIEVPEKRAGLFIDIDRIVSEVDAFNRQKKGKKQNKTNKFDKKKK